MRITFLTSGQHYLLEVEPITELDNLKAVLEIETGIPASEQKLFYHGQEWRTGVLATLGVAQDDLIELRRNVPPTPSVPSSSQGSKQQQQLPANLAALKQMCINNPSYLEHIRQRNPGLAQAILASTPASSPSPSSNNPSAASFLGFDPLDVEAQKRIEEGIRMQQVLENYENAIEHNPESFFKVHLLYIDVVVNGHPIKAFVDTGAQVTVMSSKCAQDCGERDRLMRLLDTRFAGFAKGVGTAPILGRIHAAVIRVGELNLQCAFTVIEGTDLNLLFGLDMLRRHEANINLKTNSLIISNHEIPFLPEHQLPLSARMEEEVEEIPQQSESATSTTTTTTATTSNTSNNNPVFENAMISEEKITAVMALGVNREKAIAALRRAEGNVEVAAAMIFF